MNAVEPAVAYGSFKLGEDGHADDAKKAIDKLVEKHRTKATQYTIGGILFDVLGTQSQHKTGEVLAFDLKEYVAAEYPELSKVEIQFQAN
jgi:hypothetical protein